MIKLVNVSKEYKLGNDSFFAIKDISLEIKSGEYCAIMGPSGSGKSTLMHVIGLLDEPTSGKIFVDKKDVSELSDARLSQLRNEFVGFVFQQFNLINKLNVLENIMLPTIYARKKLNFNPEQKALSLLERFGMKEKAYSYPNKISGGQQQRVAIARALINQPKLILADEPTGNLDTKTGGEILKLLGKLHYKEKITVIIVTHDPSIAKRTDRIIKITDGQINL